ncbi:MAG: 16S rRNA (cytidine(1402)-2'-O)-methyltransferase [Candidatus Marinimicrobia bacterium]|nr:16S rRNA (cytidine(1402)-2'-O)-methyltransferase [Candidatus Neomarinimicrobiota bacterium]MDP6167181.1 16S rRNA (cytidine(1402)-2'-O)-methyltransferase [Candidatus Neomarinimicrobiota bacterium]MDP6401442.1 16S rRNA (cytidine(1402)-2'-O)-methyltransferase [Candidatus Neomarinimicrobiota bacterium]MDP6614339.1 16S rRNA (cytidine(1402)-2'-O)-methyltransferase [Candidatus Neomarinimicrobiota bacterium]MDP6820149.1 16S rRNA (cytidine(1402)-2'-O)-methyltransferase [Candidatus Neomarinimicrobiota
MTAETGTLYIVSTPIGNLGDFTFRAVETLKLVSLVAAEDTRHSKKLFSHYKIQTPLISYYEHNKFTRIPIIIDHLLNGNDLALISDAGTPGISDPAYKLIREAIKEEITIESIPGASASLAALISSGLPTDRFIFEGFLPPKKGRKARISRVRGEQATLIYYESPKRLQRTLKDLLDGLGDRPAVVSRELTKLHEEIKRGTLSELLSYFKTRSLRGECVILIGKNDQNVYF